MCWGKPIDAGSLPIIREIRRRQRSGPGVSSEIQMGLMGASFLGSRSLLYLVVGIPPRLFREVGSPAPALKVVFELRLATLNVSIDKATGIVVRH